MSEVDARSKLRFSIKEGKEINLSGRDIHILLLDRSITLALCIQGPINPER